MGTLFGRVSYCAILVIQSTKECGSAERRTRDVELVLTLDGNSRGNKSYTEFTNFLQSTFFGSRVPRFRDSKKFDPSLL